MAKGLNARGFDPRIFYAGSNPATLAQERSFDMKGNIHKKATFEDRFDRKYACWVKNNRKAWRWWKRKNRKDFRRKQKIEIRKELEEIENVTMENTSDS